MERVNSWSTAHLLDRVGDKWSLYILGALREGPRRFYELIPVVEGVSQRMLTLSLRGLERDGLVTRTIHPTTPPRVDYTLTKLGWTLLEPVMALVEWADRNRSAIQDARTTYDATYDAAESPISPSFFI